ncbi:MAG: hypothetical protein R3Y32_09220 [Bacillota bacterium]
MKKNKNHKALINIFLIFNLLLWVAIFLIAQVKENIVLIIISFILAVISGVACALIVYGPFVESALGDSNPVFGKPKPKVQAKKDSELTDEEKKYRMK